MKTILRTLLMAVLTTLPLTASAQKSSDPEGYVTYSLPSTTIVLDVEAVRENFYAGPYARFAEKYLGIKARQKNEVKWQVSKISLTPVVEADLTKRYSLQLKKNTPDLTFLKLSSAGLIAFANAKDPSAQTWSTPSSGNSDFSKRGVASNLTSEATTLYRSDRTDAEYSRVSVQQNMVVEKTLEQRAAEAAQMIIRLREQKLQIVTGDTDATYSGEAMGTAIAELNRLEEEYMSMFVGYSDYMTQVKSFDVMPVADRESQMYVAFRISDTAGLVPSDNLSGKPVVMEIVPQDSVPSEPAAQGSTKHQTFKYLIPATCTIKVKDGQELLIQSRVPVYQLGVLGTMPVNATLQ